MKMFLLAGRELSPRELGFSNLLDLLTSSPHVRQLFSYFQCCGAGALPTSFLVEPELSLSHHLKLKRPGAFNSSATLIIRWVQLSVRLEEHTENHAYLTVNKRASEKKKVKFFLLCMYVRWTNELEPGQNSR